MHIEDTPSPNFDDRKHPVSLLVLHYTGMESGDAALARMRAIETGRGVVNVSTTGTSQAFAPDGTILDELPTDTIGARVTTIPLRTGLTPAVSLGPWIAGLLAATSLLGLLLLRFAARR